MPAVPMRVAIQGELGSFSHEAALALAPGAEIVPCALSAEVFRRLVAGEAEAAVIPIENSLAGSILEHYDLLLANEVRIEQEYLLRIRHMLVAPPGASLTDLHQVFSHPIALEQCRGFFRLHPYLQPTAFYDTAGSVKHILANQSAQPSGQPPCGAIASRQAATQYGGAILAESIEDNPENYTRFFLIRTNAQSTLDPHSSRVHPPIAANKVSLCFAVDNQPGSLVSALQIFAGHRINLTKIESRPVPGSPWHYIFYADYQMERPDQADAALAELASRCSMLKELGRYPAAPRP